jgi:GTP-binding protein EngB required for normal cell division
MNDSAGRIELIRRLCERFDVQPLFPQMQACMEALDNGGGVEVALLGLFKAGKSSFLNALLGKDVLPVDVLPTTAVITRVLFGPRERAVVRHLGGESLEISVDDIHQFATEQGNPGNVKQVACVDVETPAMEAWRGLSFVDTPGVGSIYSHNTEVLHDWLPRVGCALVAIPINQPLGKQDLDILMRTLEHTPEVILLLTKADLLPEGERNKVIDFTRRQIAERGGDELPVLLYSNRAGYESLQCEARDYILDHIVSRPEALSERILNHKVRALQDGVMDYLLLAEGAAKSAEVERADLLRSLSSEMAAMTSLKNELRLLTGHIKSKARIAAEGHFHSVAKALTRDLREECRHRMADWEGNLADRTEAYRTWLAERLAESLKPISESGRPRLDSFLRDAEGSIDRMVRACKDRLSVEISRVLGVSFQGARFQALVTPPPEPDIHVGQVFDSHLELIWFVIPMLVFRPLLERHFLQRLPWEAEKNLARLANQWADAVAVSIDTLADQAVAFMENELTSLQRLVTDAPDRLTEIQAALASLRSLDSEE